MHTFYDYETVPGAGGSECYHLCRNGERLPCVVKVDVLDNRAVYYCTKQAGVFYDIEKAFAAGIAWAERTR